MKQKPLWKVSIATLPDAEDAVGELLCACFQQPTATYTDLETGITTITAYLPKKPDWTATHKVLKSGLARIKSCGLSIGAGMASLEKVRRENWAESWKRHFQPLVIGSSLLVKPSWSKRRAKKNQAVVILDPGLSFGTGQHPTTGFCLRQVAACAPKLQAPNSKFQKRTNASPSTLGPRLSTPSFLDIGTGSGILAIAAAKLDYAPVEAFDFDPEAVTVALANARRNQVSGKLQIRKADVTRLPMRSKQKYSLVCANLISNLLISEQPRILTTLSPHGVLVLAGILQTEFDRVQNSFEKAGLKLLTACTEKEWRSGAFAWATDRQK